MYQERCQVLITFCLKGIDEATIFLWCIKVLYCIRVLWKHTPGTEYHIKLNHYGDVTRAALGPKSPVCRLSVQKLVQIDIKEHQNRPCVKEIPRWPVDSLHKGPVMRQVWPRHDVIITFVLYLLVYCIIVTLYQNLHLALNMVSNMMTSSNGNIFRVTGPLWGESAGHRWIPLRKASGVELWSSLWSVPERMVEQTIETPVIWEVNALILTSPF